MRYSIRYVPGSATLIKGLSSKWSVLDNSANFGRTLDEVAAETENEYWYPKVWPSVEETIGSKTIEIDESKLEIKEKEKELFTEMRAMMQNSKHNKA